MLKSTHTLLIACTLAVLSLMVPATSIGWAAEESTPQPVLTFSEDISEWRMSSGFIYLTKSCRDFSSQTASYISRRAIHSTILANLESVNGTPQCRTFRHAAADESGIYYYNRNLGRLEAIYSDRPTDPPTPLATIGDWTRIGAGDGISNLRLRGSYVYWIEVITNGEFTPDDITIKRVAKSGGTPATMISYSTASQASIDGLGITSSHIWWTDSDGLNRLSLCVRACVPGPVVKTVEFPLSAGEGTIQVNGSNVFWWNGDENPERIRRTRCSLFGSSCSTNTVHTPSSSTRIIGLDANSESAFWTEDVSLVGRRLRRAPIAGGTAETIADSVHFATPYLDVDGIYFQQGIRAIVRLPLNADAIVREIGITGWEMTQGIQRLANDVPLVAGKTTYVRLYPTLQDGTDVGAVMAELHGSRDNQPLPGSPIYPENITIPITDGLTLANRVDSTGGWLFRLPESWTRTGDGLIAQSDTTITLRAVVDPYRVYADSDNPNDNTIQGDFLFTAKAPTCMVMRPVSTEGFYQPVYGYNVSQVVALSETVLPTAKLITFPKNDLLREIDWCWKGIVYGPFCSTPYELSDDDSGLLTKMGWLDFWADNPSICVTNNARTLYAGIIHKQAPWDWGGLARRGKDQLLTKVPTYGDPINRLNGLAMTMVHEIGHSYDRRHIDCGAPLGPDPNYPYPTNMLDFGLTLDNPDLHIGFDPQARTPINPLVTKDFMSYCGPEWYSDYTWRAIFNKTRDPIFVPLPRAGAAGEIVRVAGLIDMDDQQGTLDYAWALPMSTASENQRQKWTADLAPAWDGRAPQATYHVQFIGAGGQLLADHDIDLGDVDDGDQDGSKPFELLVPAPATPVAQLRLMQDDMILATLSPGLAQPTVAVSQPTPGTTVESEVTIVWTASDPDDSHLFYTVQYSPNGGEHWFPLLVNFGGSGGDTQTITLDIAGEAGSSNALIRVLVSDGYNTGMGISQPFTVAARKPTVTIASPAPAELFRADETIPLYGVASDPEDGVIADDQFVWSSGQVGQTAEIRGLAPGTHTVHLTATDSNGLSGSSSVSFDVAPLGVPETSSGFTLDGRCDEAGYQDASPLPLEAYPNGSRASAQIIHTSSSLWLCISGLDSSGGYAGLLVDKDNSGDSAIQPGDFGYFVRQDGTRFVLEGDGSSLVAAPSDPLSARIYDHGDIWSAELLVRKSALGSWQQRLSLAIGHFAQGGDDASLWPKDAAMLNPQSWAETNLGLIAAVASVDPQSSEVGGMDIGLTVSGANFDESHVVLWNGAELPTGLVDSTTLTAVVPVAMATAAGTYSVSLGVDGIEQLTTASFPFVLNNPQPSIGSLSPAGADAGSSGRTVSINGSNFVEGAVVVWNGDIRSAAYVSPTQLQLTLTPADLADNGDIPVVVINPEPTVGPSARTIFVISPSVRLQFLPLVAGQ